MMGLRSFISGISGTVRGSIVVAALMSFGCQGADGDSAAADDIVTVQGALGGVTSTNLQLQVSKNACAGNMAQNYFKVRNASTAAVPLSQISIKYWINDTSTPNIVPAVWYGGCVTTANGTCVHQMTGVTATAVRFSPACGPDASHQANWEITISTTDPDGARPRADLERRPDRGEPRQLGQLHARLGDLVQRLRERPAVCGRPALRRLRERRPGHVAGGAAAELPRASAARTVTSC